MDIWSGGMFLHMFMSWGPETEICTKCSSLGWEELVGVCDPELFTCRARHSDLGVVLGDISCEVCSTYGKRATSTGISVAQADDWVDDKDHQDGYIESHFLSEVCYFRADADVVLLEYAKGGDLRVHVDSTVWTLIELQSNSRMREIKLYIQRIEEGLVSV